MESQQRLSCSLLFSLVATGALAAQTTTDAIHYKLEIELHFASRTITGRQTATFRSLTDNLRTLDLDLISRLRVNSVTTGTGKILTFTRPADKISITLDRAYSNKESLTVVVDYDGQPGTSTGWGGFRFTTHAGQNLAWTLSEPWDAKTWWPGKDVLDDKSTFEMWITHPDTMSAASNGTLQGIDTLSGNRLRTRWKESYPMIPYLASLAVTNYKKRVDTYTHLGANMPVEFYVFPESWSSWQGGMDKIVPMLKAFSDAFGQFPFVNEKYGIAQFNWGGGMEHQTITSQSSVAEWLSAHELTHSWWGDAITCKTWHDIWLNEGFATFGEALWEERKPGGSMAAYRSWMLGRKPRNVSGTVYCYNISSVSRIFNSDYTYRKAGWVVHMLRGVLGETLFWKALADYRVAYEGSSASTEDFRKSVEKTAGRDMGWFFDQWVMKGGMPTYSHAWASRTVGGRSYVYLQIDQTQSYQPVFEMPLRIVVATAAGSETHTVWNDARQDAFVLPLASPATTLAVDPDDWILRAATTKKSFGQTFFAATAKEIDVTRGGAVELHMEQGPAFQGRVYVMLIGISGTAPGTKLFGLTIPLNFDPMTTLGLAALNTPLFASFLGTLDARGGGAATLTLPAGLATALKGRMLHAAYVLADRFDFASSPLGIALR